MSTTAPIAKSLESNPKFAIGPRTLAHVRHKGVRGDCEANKVNTAVVPPMQGNPIKNYIRTIPASIVVDEAKAGNIDVVRLLSTSTSNFGFEAILSSMLDYAGIPYTFTCVELSPNEFERCIEMKRADFQLVKGDFFKVAKRPLQFNAANLCVASDKSDVVSSGTFNPAEYNVGWPDLCLTPNDDFINAAAELCSDFAARADATTSGALLFLGFYGYGGRATHWYKRLTGFSGNTTQELANADIIRLLRSNLAARGIVFDVKCNLDYLGGTRTHISLVGLGFGKCHVGVDAHFRHISWFPKTHTAAYSSVNNVTTEFKHDWNKANRKYSVVV